MRQLTSLDVQFLALEDDRNTGHVGGLALYDPSTAPGGRLTVEALRAHVASRLPLLPPMRWRLRRVPLNLDHPYWIDDPDVDLDYHVRELALPAPGDERRLAEQAARIFERRLDRSRPLWEMYLIHGVDGGERCAVLTKIHHAALDGLSGAEVLVALLDVDPAGRELGTLPAVDRPSVPGTLELLARGLIGAPRRTARSLEHLPRTLPHIDLVPTVRSVPGVQGVARVARRVAALRPGAGERPAVDSPVAPRTALNGRVSAHRRVAFQSIPLQDIKDLKNHFGVTVNDVVVATVAGAVRAWLLDRDELPAEPLLAMIPVSVRLPEEAGTFGNRVSMMVAPIPTHLPDPAQRLIFAHDALVAAKARHAATPRMLMEEANDAIPPIVLGPTARLLFGLGSSSHAHPPLNLVVSNVPGPPMPVYLAGARMEAHYPLSVVTDGMGLNITVLSYCDRVDFGIVADREEVPDAWRVADLLRESFAAMQAPRVAVA